MLTIEITVRVLQAENPYEGLEMRQNIRIEDLNFQEIVQVLSRFDELSRLIKKEKEVAIS